MVFAAHLCWFMPSCGLGVTVQKCCWPVYVCPWSAPDLIEQKTLEGNMKPHVICHMGVSLDGRTLRGRWRPKGAVANGVFERLHEELRGDAWLIGRVTGQEFAKGQAYPAHTHETFPRNLSTFGGVGVICYAATPANRTFSPKYLFEKVPAASSSRNGWPENKRP
jgi:hypothetical protein